MRFMRVSRTVFSLRLSKFAADAKQRSSRPCNARLLCSAGAFCKESTMSGRTLLLAAFLLAAAGGASAEPNLVASLRFLGATTIPNDTKVDGTLVGGLSGLDYNPASGTWAVISDDKSDKAPARFYLGRIDVSEGAPKVTLDHAEVLLQAD